MNDTSNLNIPAELKEKYPKLLELILETKSMDDDERQYWFNIMPIMKSEQIEKLKEILITEKQKIQEINTHYSSDLQNVGKPSNFNAKTHKDKQRERIKEELEHEKQEETAEDALLGEIESH